jgi:hypothetical protein
MFSYYIEHIKIKHISFFFKKSSDCENEFVGGAFSSSQLLSIGRTLNGESAEVQSDVTNI